MPQPQFVPVTLGKTPNNAYNAPDDPPAGSRALIQAPIGLFYGSSTCYTEIAAERIVELLGAARVDLYNIAEQGLAPAADYRWLIFGIPTWDYGELQEDWEDRWDELDEINFRGKTVALFGLGDQLGYPTWFQDAMGYLHQKVMSLGATCVGSWPASGYRFEKSQALDSSGRYFVGLALDEENEFEKSPERLATWCQQVQEAFRLPAG